MLVLGVNYNEIMKYEWWDLGYFERLKILRGWSLSYLVLVVFLMLLIWGY